MLSLFAPFSVYATTVPVPDTGPFIVNYEAYENTYTLNDVLLLVEYNIPYASLPSNSATVNFLVRLLDPNGNVLGTVTPFAYENLGYGYGCAAIYFAPSTIAWGATDSVQIIGNPGVSWVGATVPNVTAPMMPSNWSASSTVAVGQTQACQQVISIAVDLENRWNVALTSSAVAGTVMNSYGQQYFGSVIPYFSTICGTILTYTAPQPVNASPINGSAASGVTGVLTVSPAELSPGTSTVLISVAGDFTITLPADHSGSALSGTAAINNSPVTLGAGINNLIAQSPGTVTIIQNAFNQSYAQSLANIWPSAVTTLPDGTVVGVGVSIQNAATSMGTTPDALIFGYFLIIIGFVMAIAASAMGGAQYIPLLFTPTFVGCIKIGVIPMALGVGLIAVLFIVSMFFLIHRRAPV